MSEMAKSGTLAGIRTSRDGIGRAKLAGRHLIVVLAGTVPFATGGRATAAEISPTI